MTIWIDDKSQILKSKMGYLFFYHMGRSYQDGTWALRGFVNMQVQLFTFSQMDS